MAHDGEEEEHLQAVDEYEDGEEDIKAGEGEVGQSTEKSVGKERDADHFGGKEETGF